MHNCRLTKNQLLDLALEEVGTADEKRLREELDQCRACREEYGSLKNALRVTGQALQSALPTDDFWPEHHTRLQVRLVNNSSSVQSVRPSWQERAWSGLRQIATTSVRVPAPAAVAFVVLMGILLVALPQRVAVDPIPANPLASVATRTVTVPVIQEKLVTKVVYVEKSSRRSRKIANPMERPAPSGANNVARLGWESSGKSAMSLVGFKPTDQLRLTIIKRGQNEK